MNKLSRILRIVGTAALIIGAVLLVVGLYIIFTKAEANGRVMAVGGSIGLVAGFILILTGVIYNRFLPFKNKEK